MTPWMLTTLGLTVLGQVVYQFGQKSVPATASPLIVLSAAYFAAGFLCIGIAWPLGSFGPGANLRLALGWPTWLIALSIVAIEVGYLTAYRSGWTIGTAFATASTATVFALALAGWLALGSALSVRQLAGLACSCVAVWLLSGNGPQS